MRLEITLEGREEPIYIFSAPLSDEIIMDLVDKIDRIILTILEVKQANEFLMEFEWRRREI